MRKTAVVERKDKDKSMRAWIIKNEELKIVNF